MTPLFRIGFRNLLRQKRRNLLLGAAIAIGMAILVMANAFSHGISDVLFNRILSYVSGNVSVSFAEGGNRMRQVFHDGARMRDLTRNALPGLTSMEEAVGVFARAIGNGRNDNVILVGMDAGGPATEKEMADLEENFRMLEGAYVDLLRDDLENPVLLGEDKARSLNVGLHDIVRVRFQDVNGQNQAARLTVAGIFRPANVFMNAPVFLDIGHLKRLAGYGPGDIGQLYLMLPDPKKNAVRAADVLHAALAPPLARVRGRLEHGARARAATVLGFKVDSASLSALGRLARRDAALTRKDVLVGRALADSLNVRAGDRVSLSYAAKSGREATAEFTVTGVAPPSSAVPGDAILVNDEDFFAFYYRDWPEAAAGDALADSAHPLHAFLAREWVLLDRTGTTEEMQKKFKEMPRLKTKAVVVDVATMYETASMIIKLEYALNLITLGAVLILFFIIQVGVANTLRMAVRERTREIGTMRAIGMQKSSVRDLFLMETFFLSLIACLAGVALAFAGMWLLRLVPLDAGTNPLGMLLVHGRLHFKPSLAATGAYLALILSIAVGTAWFPSRRAARLPPSEALRHFG